MRNRRATCVGCVAAGRTRSISFAAMRVRRSGAAVGVFLLAFAAGCSNPLGRQYEYEEQIYLSVDGSATVIVDASIPAFVALRGAAFDPSMAAGVNRDQVRAWLESSGCRDVRVGQPWVRRGRRFVQVRISVTDIRELGSCGALGWSRYQFERGDEAIHFVQEVGRIGRRQSGHRELGRQGARRVQAARAQPHPLSQRATARGRIARRCRSREHPDLGTDARRSPCRPAAPPGSADGPESILFRTLSLFAMAFAAAVLVLTGIVWMTIRGAKRRKSNKHVGIAHASVRHLDVLHLFLALTQRDRERDRDELIQEVRVVPLARLDVGHGRQPIVAGRQARGPMNEPSVPGRVEAMRRERGSQYRVSVGKTTIVKSAVGRPIAS